MFGRRKSGDVSRSAESLTADARTPDARTPDARTPDARSPDTRLGNTRVARSRVTTSRRSPSTASATDQQAHRTTATLHWMTVLLALLASLTFVLADADRARSSASVWIQITIEVVAALGFTWLVRRRIGVMNERPLVIPILLLVVLLSLLWEPLQRWLFQTGRPFETMVMNSQKTLMLATAVFGSRITYQRLSVIIGVDLVI